jgi:hypothetical protein
MKIQIKDIIGKTIFEYDQIENSIKSSLIKAVKSGANLRGADLPNYSILPDGDLIGWKKISKVLIKLEIPKKAKRVNSLVGRKCRANFAKILKVYNDQKSVQGGHAGLTYTEGETIYPDKFDDDIRIECTHGIHFFITKQEAENW